MPRLTMPPADAPTHPALIDALARRGRTWGANNAILLHAHFNYLHGSPDAKQRGWWPSGAARPYAPAPWLGVVTYQSKHAPDPT